MNNIKTAFSAFLRWSWFGLLVILAFGYLAAGLSNPPQKRVELKNELDSTQNPTNRISEDSIAETIQLVNDHWAASLQEKGIPHAEPANWLTNCRRISLA